MICEFDRGIGDLEGHVLGDPTDLLAEALLEAVPVILAVIVVLHQHADPGVLDVGQDVLGVDHRLGVVIGRVTHGPRELLGIAPLRGAGGDEELRHLLLVHVFVDRGVARRAQRVEGAQHFVLLDELSDHLDRLGRRVAVIEADELDLAAVDAALVIDHVPEGYDRLAIDAVGRGRSAIGTGVADLDLTVAGAVVVFLLAERHRRRRNDRGRRGAAQECTPAGLHLSSRTRNSLVPAGKPTPLDPKAKPPPSHMSAILLPKCRPGYDTTLLRNVKRLRPGAR